MLLLLLCACARTYVCVYNRRKKSFFYFFHILPPPSSHRTHTPSTAYASPFDRREHQYIFVCYNKVKCFRFCRTVSIDTGGDSNKVIYSLFHKHSFSISFYIYPYQLVSVWVKKKVLNVNVGVRLSIRFCRFSNTKSMCVCLCVYLLWNLLELSLSVFVQQKMNTIRLYQILDIYTHMHSTHYN